MSKPEYVNDLPVNRVFDSEGKYIFVGSTIGGVDFDAGLVRGIARRLSRSRHENVPGIFPGLALFKLNSLAIASQKQLPWVLQIRVDQRNSLLLSSFPS